MRRRSRPHRAPSLSRSLRALPALLVLLALTALPAGAQDQPPPEQFVVIELPGGLPPHRIPWSSLSGSAKEFKVDLPSGDNTPLQAVTLEQVLNKIQRTRDEISSIGLTREDGAPMTISRVQLTKYYNDPLVYLDAAGVLSLVRPKLIGNPAEVAKAIDGTLTLRIGSQPKLTVNPETVAVGQEASFEVSVPLDIEDRSKVTFLWDFNDDQPVVRNRSSEMTRSFAKPDTYNVIVAYEVDGQLWAGLSPSVTVTVTAPPKKDSDRNARKSDRRRGPRDDEQGGGGDDEEIVDPGGGSGSGIGGESGDGTGGAGGSNTGGWDQSAAVTPPPPAAPRTDRRQQPRRAAPPSEPVGETVDGYLLAAADVPLPTGGAVRATVADPEPLDDERPLDIPTAVWVVIGVLGLGLLGWTLESRTTLPYFKP